MTVDSPDDGDEGDRPAVERPVESRSHNPEMGEIHDAVSDALERVDRALGGCEAGNYEFLVEDLDGRVLEVGGATGRTLRHLRDHPTPDSVAFADVDPDLLAHAATKVDDVEFEVSLEAADARALPFADDSFDAVVCMYLFCQFDETGAALREIDRVLRPDGEFRFVEHVRSTGARRHIEPVVYPAWKRAVSGCDMRAATGTAIRESPLTVVESHRIGGGLLPPWEYVRGRATPSTGGRDWSRSSPEE